MSDRESLTKRIGWRESDRELDGESWMERVGQRELDGESQMRKLDERIG